MEKRLFSRKEAMDITGLSSGELKRAELRYLLAECGHKTDGAKIRSMNNGASFSFGALMQYAFSYGNEKTRSKIMTRCSIYRNVEVI